MHTEIGLPALFAKRAVENKMDVESLRVDDLPERVYAGVGPAGHAEPVDGREQSVQRLAQRRLDGRQSRLRRPAVERRAVVLERELQTHVRRP